MEYIALALIIGVAGYFLVRQVRKTWRGDSPCSCCDHKSEQEKDKKDSGCGCGRKH